MPSELVKIKTVYQEQEAMIICENLKNFGIHANYLSTRDSSYPMLGQVDIYCPQKDAPQAIEIINRHSFENN